MDAALDWTKIIVALIGFGGIVVGAFIGALQTRAARLERLLWGGLTNDTRSADVWNNAIVGKIAQDETLRRKFVNQFLYDELVRDKIRSIAQDTSKAAAPLSETESQDVAAQPPHLFGMEPAGPMILARKPARGSGPRRASRGNQ